MIAGFVYDKQKEERELVVTETKDAIALLTEDESEIYVCQTAAELSGCLTKMDIGTFGCIDLASDGTVQVAEKIRQKYPDMAILLIVDAKVPPTAYIRPSIMASSLLIRPAKPGTVKETLREFLESTLQIPEDTKEAAYVLEGKSGTVRIPYHAVYYAEASMKKVFIRLKNEEYSFFGTLEKLLEELPDSFVRCHRSFLVNSKKVKQFLAAENVLVLEDNTRIPVSRSYKKAMRELLK